MSIIMQSRKNLQFHNNDSMVKKSGEEESDVFMGYDRAEVCELVGCYILNQLSSVIRKEFAGLYHYRLCIFKNRSKYLQIYHVTTMCLKKLFLYMKLH